MATDNTSPASQQKPDLPRTIPPMRDTPPIQQDELRKRHQVRSDIREAIKQLRAVFKSWVNDLVLDPQRFEQFHASGHQGEYLVFPEGTLAAKLVQLGWTREQIDELNTIKTPMDLMSVVELSAVLQRIEMMLDWFHRQPQGGPFRRACDIYEAVGQFVRRQVIQQTGHPPEQFPTPDVIITGAADEVRRVKPAPYRATLFPPDSAEEKKP